MFDRQARAKGMDFNYQSDLTVACHEVLRYHQRVLTV